MAFKDRISGMFRFGGKEKGKPGEGSKAIPDGGDPARSDTVTTAAELATEEEREALLQELSHGFVSVGATIERLDENLSAGTRSLEAMTQVQERLPSLLAEQQHLIQEVAETATASRRALEALGEHLQQRDAAQVAIVERLEALGQSMDRQRDAHKEQLELVMRVHRSGRLFTGLLILGGFLLIVALLGALLYVIFQDRLAKPEAATAALPPAAAPASVPAASAPTADASTGSAIAPLEAGTAVATPAYPGADPATDGIDLTRIGALLTQAAESDDPTIARRAQAALATTD